MAQNELLCNEVFVAEIFMQTLSTRTRALALLTVLLFILTGHFSPLSAQLLLPLPQNFVTDSAHLFTDSEQRHLEEMLRNYEDSTSREILIVTVKDFAGYSVNAFATELANQWQIGKQSTNNGVLILLRPSKMPPLLLPETMNWEWEIFRQRNTNWDLGAELNSILSILWEDSTYQTHYQQRPLGDYGEGYIATGRGMEGALPDILCARIMHTVVAPFAIAHRYADGLEAGLCAIFTALTNEYITLEEGSQIREEESGFPVILLLIFGYLGLGLLSAFAKLLLQSFEHIIHYYSTPNLRKQYSFVGYWWPKTLQSAKRIIKQLPTILINILLLFLSRGSINGRNSSGGRRGGSFGGGGGGAHF
jgi:hypothetical protein